MRLNCVILNYNDAKTVIDLLRLIHDYDVLEQIVVVDNASTDDSRELLAAVCDDKVAVIRAEQNGGYGAGNNLGVRYAAETNGATHVLIANPDVSFSEDCLCKLLRMFENHPDAGVVTAAMHDAEYPDMRNGWPLRGYVRELLSMGPVCRRLFKRWLEYPESYYAEKKAVYVDAVHGSMLMVDANRFLDAGGYDEGIFLYQEEAVLGWRMKTSGYRTILLLNCSYDHAHSASISRTVQGQLDRQRLREESALYYMKHYLFINPLQEAFARLWFWGIRMEVRIARFVSR